MNGLNHRQVNLKLVSLSACSPVILAKTVHFHVHTFGIYGSIIR